MLREGSVESLRIVPSKSAASGVYTIYFSSAHREWALVRLAIRYRWLFEIQLNRGMSGEHQLLQQGFTPDDLAFLFDIVPAPPEEYSPVVYDMLWLVATYDEYRALTAAMLERQRFTPRELFEAVPTVDKSKIGLLTRFLRSHLIEPETTASDQIQSQNADSNADLQAVVDETYTVTPDGETALRGILVEYNRIFVEADFDSLFINSELDPQRHFAEQNSDVEQPTPDVSFDDIQSEGGMLGEIASAFSSMVDEEDVSGTDDSADTGDKSAVDVHADEETAINNDEAAQIASGSQAPDSERHSPSAEVETLGSDLSDVTGNSVVNPDRGIDGEPAEGSTEPREFGAYTEAEVVDGTVAAAKYIRERTVARVNQIKQAVWDEVPVGNRDRTELWEYVTQVLIEMDGVYGRPDGRIWTTL
jgi:hypothetical protein